VAWISDARVVSAAAGTVAFCPEEGRAVAASIINNSKDNEGFMQPVSGRNTGIFLICFSIVREVRPGYFGAE
jgi:hypothetical protein